MEEKHYYPALDNYIKLYMTTFGKIKLSIIPEGTSYTVYHYFKNQHKMPSYDEFFNSCVQQCQQSKIDLAERFERFKEFCKKHNIDQTKTPTTFVPQITQECEHNVEEEFWIVERAKLNPAGIAAAYAYGYQPNPYRKRMIELKKYKHPELFKAYITVHEASDNAIKSYDTHKDYLIQLSQAFK